MNGRDADTLLVGKDGDRKHRNDDRRQREQPSQGCDFIEVNDMKRLLLLAAFCGMTVMSIGAPFSLVVHVAAGYIPYCLSGQSLSGGPFTKHRGLMSVRKRSRLGIVCYVMKELIAVG